MTFITRRRFLARNVAGGCAAALLGSFARSSLADDRDFESSAAEMLTDAAQRAIRRGLDFLAAQQRDDGSFGASGYGANVGVCGLAGMAFISAGSTPGRGRYGKNVRRCLDYVVSRAGENGFISDEDSAGHGPMYGHGFATLMLAECYGMSPRRDLRERLARAVELIIATQNEKGGWRYQPQREVADISVTVCQVMALRAARNAGIYVPAETIDRSVDYIKRCQNPDGGFMYMLEGRPSSAFPRSAAGVSALYSAGIYEGPEIEKGLAYLMQFAPQAEALTHLGHYYYGHYYAVQAMWQAGGRWWQGWYPAVRDEIVALQRESGYWLDPVGRQYATAMACITLQMPNNYLPIFQR
jgi:hypothetical protein